ncbi:MAG: nucleotidyltransferase domain-containing protein [Rhodothermus sp.]|nr:nucleotidyltransferase domain-containing protein [Rhodothermus sp.]
MKLSVSDRAVLVSQLRPRLEVRSEIVFALLFGSVARGQATPLSDVDVGIYVDRPLDLLELGGLVSELELAVRRPVDVVILNEALKRRPALAYEAAAHGQLICCRDEAQWVDFKYRAFLAYFDTEPLRRMRREAFLERLKNRALGERKYTGTPPSS